MMISAFSNHKHEYLLNIVFSGFVSALMVGGKAIGKGLAISRCNSIMFFVGKLVSFIIPVRRKAGKKDRKG